MKDNTNKTARMKAELTDLIRKHKKISATDLTQLLGKHKSTVSPYLQELTAAGVIMDAGFCESGSRGGKPRQLLSLNPAYSYVLGIDASSDKLKGGVYDFIGSQIIYQERPYRDRYDGIIVQEDIIGFIDTLLTYMHKLDGTCAGIGVGFSGHIDSSSGCIFRSRSLGLHDCNLAADLQKRFSLPVRIQNDANAALMGEKWFYLDYQETNLNNIVYFFIDNFFTSVGFGLLLNGRLFEGSQGLAGELSVYSVGMGVGPQLIASIQACTPELLDNNDNNPCKLSDPRVKAVQEIFTIYAKKLVYVLELVNPDLIVIGGNFDPSYNYLLDPFVQYTRKYAAENLEPYIQYDIRLSGIQYPPVCAGATVPLFESLIAAL